MALTKSRDRRSRGPRGGPVQDILNDGPDGISKAPPDWRKGRGTASNRDGRFERLCHEAVDDGWRLAGDDEPPPRLLSELATERPRSVISRNTSPDIGFDRSINPYRGCEHGCVYCYARPTHAYLGLSPGLDFETRITVKRGAAEVLERQLAKPGYQAAPIMLGANTDAWQPVERETGETRRILEVLARARHPVAIATKSALILRDIDLLAEMAAQGLAAVGITVTTLDRSLARHMEPRAAPPSRRLETLRALSDAGIPVSVLASPVIPALNDWELERILAAAAEAGAVGANYVLLRLPLELKDLFSEWLDHHAPGRKAHVLSLMRQSRDGALYVADFSTRMAGSGRHADLLAQRFRLACKKNGLKQVSAAGRDLRSDLFSPPVPKGGQYGLFG